MGLARVFLREDEEAQPGRPSAKNDPATLYSAHFEKGRFFNPWHRFEAGPWKVFQAFVLTRNRYDSQRQPLVPRVANQGPALSKAVEGARVTWAGHATFAIQEGEDLFLTDPHFGRRAAVVKRHQAPGFPLDSVPENAVALISHNHYDHLDRRTVRRLPKSTQWLVPLGLEHWFRRLGHSQVKELDWWQSVRRGRWVITCLPTQHWTRRLGQPANTTLACSWLLDSGRHRFLFVGDSGYFHGFREFGRRLAPIDVAILPIGAYAPRWFLRYQHMNPAEAWQAFLDLGARYMLPSHWGVFRLTHEPIDQPAIDFRRTIEQNGGDPKRAPILALGETWRLPPRSKLDIDRVAPG